MCRAAFRVHIGRGHLRKSLEWTPEPRPVRPGSPALAGRARFAELWRLLPPALVWADSASRSADRARDRARDRAQTEQPAPPPPPLPARPKAGAFQCSCSETSALHSAFFLGQRSRALLRRIPSTATPGSPRHMLSVTKALPCSNASLPCGCRETLAEINAPRTVGLAFFS